MYNFLFQDTINALTNQNTILQTQNNHDASVNSSDEEISRVSTMIQNYLKLSTKLSKIALVTISMEKQDVTIYRVKSVFLSGQHSGTSMYYIVNTAFRCRGFFRQ